VGLTATLVGSFFGCAATCSGSIVGCYAPSGDHCQKPLEAGLRANVMFIAVRGADGAEVESVEVLLTDQGLLCYQAYTNGHSWDTEPLYTALFAKLLSDGR